ncbi:pyridoxal phosphate-dependent aminotransferase [Tsukamurella sp. 8F]|uniref:pyridoxal phosphate-dependent aminotransferase n=1 Tax=unclassified Tsukamurella TaxID=2633480 RepID=UPI0023B97785|nr:MULTISPECIES: pyridoxal phosphate-dependent aminotransferase [unclassified Tsukamurella]MDF0531167.1 pyridoxal phosphate-dependent aminotransferase [Tsukamurella sp. 8J]MDF0585886.1 pyridoxal phosphate-dependent aminotransferase [Tsukamurella sp. 8F]
MQAPADILDSGSLSNRMEDARMIADYQAAGSNIDELIYLSLGETWADTPPGLVAALADIPNHANGYQLTPYGLPALRNVLREYIIRTHDLDDVTPGWFDVSVSQCGTRSAMADFGQFIRSCTPKRRVALVPEPGWDYPGVLAPLGFSVRTYPLTQRQDWQPDTEAVEEMIRTSPDTGLLVLNPQHNPTGSDWTPSVVARLLDLAEERGVAVLLDDAYYAVHTPGTAPTNALRILLSERRTQPWLAVRTLGKQFRCNGWGLGALTGRPETLGILAAIAHRRYYGSAVPLQAAMASWLADPESDRYIEQLGDHYVRTRDQVHSRLVGDLGFPDHAVSPGTCTSYLRFQVPPSFAADHDEDAYRRLCLAAGVLPGRGSMTAPSRHGGNDDRSSWVRIHLGHPPQVLDDAFDRLLATGLGWK